MKKTLILIIYTLIHTIGAFASVEVDFMYYNLLQDNRAEVVASSSSHYVGDIVVPQTITYAGKEYTVIGIGDRAFQEAAITTLKLPNTIEYIGKRSFYKAKFQNSKNWTLYLPASITQIGEEAFRDTYQTRENVSIYVNLPGCNAVPKSCFYQSSLSGVNISNSTKTIQQNAFANFKGSVGLGNSIETIEEGAFSSCKGITSLENALSIRIIGNSAFAKSGVAIANLPNVEELGNNAFYNCSDLTLVSGLSNSLKSVGDNCFKDCSKLRISEPLPLYIEKIGMYAFANISYLYCFSLTPSIQSLGNYTFSNSNLQRINIYADFADFNVNVLSGSNPIGIICTTLTEPNDIMAEIVNAKGLPTSGVYVPWGCEYEYYDKPNAIFKDVEERFYTPTIYSFIKGGSARCYGFEWNEITDLAGLNYACSNAEWESELESLKNSMSLRTSAPHMPSVGNYVVEVINADGSAPNMPIGVALVNSSLTISPEDLIVRFASPTVITSVYGSIPEYELSYEGFVDGETSDVLLSPIRLEPEVTETTLPGTYTVRLKGGEAENYNIHYQGENTIVVKKAPLTIETGDYSKEYGTENPEITPIYSGFVNDETPEVLIKQPQFYCGGVLHDAEAGIYTPVGRYDIRISQQAESNRYEIDYSLGSFVIVKADQHITWDQEFNDVKVGDVIALNASLSSELPVEYSLFNNDNVAELDGNVIRFLREGSVDIYATQPGDGNHNGFSMFKTAHVALSTGIDDVATDDVPSIRVVNHQLFVKGATDSEIVRVFTLSGTTAYEGISKAITLTPGIYIVQIAGHREKVAVR